MSEVQAVKHFAKPHEQLWIYSMGKRFRVRAMFTDDLAANAYMARNRDTGAIAAFGPFVVVANLYEGVKPQDLAEIVGEPSGCCMYHQDGGNAEAVCRSVVPDDRMTGGPENRAKIVAAIHQEMFPPDHLAEAKQRIVERHKAEDAAAGRTTPCGCLTCRESRGWL